MTRLANLLPRLLLLYIATLVVCITIDTGLIKLSESLAYDLKEGQSVLARLTVLTLTTGIVITPLMLRSRQYVLLYMAALFPFLVTGLTFRLINGAFTSWEAGLMLSEIGFADDALIEFSPQIAQASIISVALLITLYYLRLPLFKGRLQSALLLAPWLLPIAYIHAAEGGYWSKHFALPVKVPTMLTYELMNPIPIMKREPVNITPSRQEQAHIIYLVDESIRGDLLSINNPLEHTTPRLPSVSKQYSAYNYRVTSAVANCSATSNLLLRTGIRPDQLPDRDALLFSQANIFQYASRAGFKTHYLDAQAEGSQLQNFFTHDEIRNIDVYWPLKSDGNDRDYMLDRKLSDAIVARIANATQQTFIYANKVGTHFPYHKSYPDPDKNLDKQSHYRGALGWAVDEFLVHLLGGLQHAGKPARIVYTSDHGQGLGEQGSVSTHCLPYRPASVQASVPLLLFSLNTEPFEQWQPQDGHYSQFQIFPSILQMMGYPTDDVREKYGIDLSSPWPGKRFFYSGDLTGRGQLSRNPFDT
jgi:glucan phosphoethanolaminetransferase (alkaline phosphatase superfamily)